MAGEVTAVVPCWNEEARIGKVLEVLTRSKYLAGVIVVNDGSSDNSVQVVKQFAKVQLVDLPKNLGKGGAMREGLARVQTEWVFFCDADLAGWTDALIGKLVQPIIDGECDLSIGINRVGGRLLRWWRLKYFPISGQRVGRTEELKQVLASPEANGWAVELYMNFYYKKHGLRVKKVELDGVTGMYNVAKYGVGYWLKRYGKLIRLYLHYARVA